MTTSRRAALPVAASLAVACLMAPATAVRPAPDEEVTLATTEGGSPVVEPGTYAFGMPALDTDSYLTVQRTVPRSTLWVAETLFSEDVKNGYVYLDPTGVDSKNQCSDEAPSVEGDDYVGYRFMTGLVRIGKGPCLGEDRVLLEHRAYDSEGKYPSGQKGQLAVWEEPPVEDASLLPPPSTTVAWDGEVQPAKGTATLGATYADAPELVAGRWDVHVDPGTPALFRVPLDWGQHLELSLQYKGAEYPEYVPIEPELITPLGGFAKWAEADGGPTFDDVNLKYPSMEAGTVSPTITWRNREKPVSNPAAFPGSYYVLLKMGTKDAPKKGADITVGVNVVTDKEPTSPYAEEGDPVPDISGKTTPADDPKGGGDPKESASGSSDGGSTPWGAVTALFGGSAVVAAAGAVSLGRYRRLLG